MKKLLLILFTISVLFSLASCSHQHVYGEWVVIKEASCTEKGITEAECSCGEKSTLYVPCLEHQLDDNYICSGCNKQVFNLTTSEKKSCEKVFMYSNAQVSHIVNDKTGEEHLEFLYSLNDESESFLAAPAFVDVKILDHSKENVLFEKTFAVKSTDYESFFFENNTLKKLLATISIKKEEIKSSAYSNGFLVFRIYNSEFFDSDAFDYVKNELDEEPIVEIKSGLPECAHEYDSRTGICKKCERLCEHSFVDDKCTVCQLPDPDKITITVTSSSGYTKAPTKEEPWELSFTDNKTSGIIAIEELVITKVTKTSFSIYIKAKISEPNDGLNYATAIGFKLKDTDGVIVQSGVLSNEISSAGEYFIIRGSLGPLTPASTYSLILFERK